MQLSSTLTVICLAALPASAQTLVRSINGPAANAQYGKACIPFGDLNSDGFTDLVVGAPGFNSQRGAIYCISGAYLAQGSGTMTLWSVAPTANQGDLFGSALVEVSDVTGDGLKDLIVGQPGYDLPTANDVGAVRVVDGVTHAVGSPRYGIRPAGALGSTIELFGPTQVVVGSPGPLASSSGVDVVFASQLTGSGQMPSSAGYGVFAGYEMGASLAPGVDLDGDGIREVIAGAPAFANSAGALVIWSLSPWSQPITYASPFAGERLGTSVDAVHDYDGDGLIDIVVGAPNALDASGHQGGRVVVLSGVRLVAQTPPYELFTLTPGVFSHVSTLTFDTHFGAAVCASPDLNHDGVGEILVGSPDYFTGFGAARGVMTIFSGASRALWAHTFGSGDDHLGGSITGALDDLDGDGFSEFVVAGALSDAGGTDSGVLKCYRLFPVAPTPYCTGKTNSLGCTPFVSGSGVASVSSAAPFTVACSNVINQKSGLMMYSHQPIASVFQGGYLCVNTPLRRTPQQNSGGSASGSDCTGSFSFDFNAQIDSALDPTLVAGAEVFAQYWSRDSQSASTTSLSNALRFVINP